MKKSSIPKNQKQYEPFTDFRGLTTEDFHGTDPNKALASLDTMADIITNSNWKDSDSLTYLVDAYRDTLKVSSGIAALSAFWSTAATLKKSEMLTEKMWKMLEMTFYDPHKRGHEQIKAAQVLVKANPDMIYLPFVAELMAAIVRGVKYGDAIKKESGESDVRLCKEAWAGFLPARSGGDYPFDNPDYFKGLIELAKKHARKKPKGHYGTVTAPSQEDLAEVISKKMGGIAPGTILKKAKSQQGRGRPRK